MGEALLTGSALAAFLAGMVAFFAPCCATVMLPSYLAGVAGAQRWRLARLTATYIAGVAVVVWPLTIGAAGLAATLNRYHTAVFVVGGIVMLAAGVATVRGWMWSVPLPQPRLGAQAGSVFLLGVFAGAATACCAPVLAGAVAIAGVSGSWTAGAALGAIYLLGLVTPLLAASLGVSRLRGRLQDVRVTLRLGGRVLQTTRVRLAGGGALVLLGLFTITLAALGLSESAPAMQRDLGRRLTEGADWLSRLTPSAVGWVLVLAFAAFVARRTFAALRVHHDHKEESA